RSFRIVRLHDCQLISADDPPAPGLVRVNAERFFAAYEADLLPYDRPRPEIPPIVVTADGLAGAFTTDPDAANGGYRYTMVSLTAKVVERRPTTHTIILETGTNQKYQIMVVFTAARYASVKDHPELVIRGVCVGVSGKFVRIENAEGTPDL